MSGLCRSCDAPVVWVETEATAKKGGRRMPLDADPTDTRKALVVENGNIVYTGQTTGDHTPIVRYVKNGRHRSHFATCPNASRHRVQR